ncbi:UDP-2,3-diacylglucosamine diphosphatase [Teredinibacter purpureus]|uniref:UDP-2,3-diacylglucosamine diphosphatase n=1 Tax=Teredinibacter purpureus TaxID=2731756 RepID=UPI0005F7C012|nr:UDP-2,3-diacylglucosamine diphosphatase [Teredinibacter purpureus]
MSVANPIRARTVWISDIHLGFKDCKADYLYSFLSSLNCDTLYLVGDIVDLWSLKKKIFWPQEHYHILLKLYELADNGTRVIYIPGNHDDPLRRFDGQKFGPIEIMHEHTYQTATGKTFWILHGDAMDTYMQYDWITQFTGDIAYNFLLFLNRWGNRFRRLFGMPYFSLAGQIKSNVQGARKAIERYKNQCIHEARAQGYDGVICGHIHSSDLDTRNNFTYANTGDWIESCTALTEDYSGQLRLLHFADKVEWQETPQNTTKNSAAA